MRRLFFTSLALAALAACAVGQPTTGGPTAGDQLRLFQGNQGLLESLVEHSVDLANAEGPVAKAKACHETAKDVGRALRTAADRDDADRVAELSEHLTAVVKLSLVPTLAEGIRTVPVGSPAEKDLKDIRDQADSDAARFEQAIPFSGKVGASAKVTDARKRLKEARGPLKP